MKTKIILSVLACAALAVSCSKSELQTPGGPGIGKPNETPVTLSLTTEKPDEAQTKTAGADTKTIAQSDAMIVTLGGPDTKATTDPVDLQKVYNLWVIQFDEATGARVGAPYYAEQHQIIQNGATISLSARLTSATAAQVVYFVANTHSPSVFFPGNCGTIAEMEQVSRRLNAKLKPTSQSGVPMFAIQEFARIESGTALTGITLRSLVAKVTVNYKVAASYEGFTLRRVQLRNVPRTIWYAAAKSAVDFPAGDATHGAESHFDYPEDIAASIDGTDGFKQLTWYMPENLRQAKTTVINEWDRVLGNTDGWATYIELEGVLTGTTRCEKITYRIPLGDFANEPNDYNVRRNVAYTLNVTLLGKNAADKRITVGTYDMSNSAIVVPNSADSGAVTFDIRKLTTGWKTTMPALGTSAALRAEILWQDGSVIDPRNVLLDKVNGLLTVQSTKRIPGNAVVALYDNATTGGNVLWSWHIWVTGYQPVKQVAVAENTAYPVLDGQVHTYGTAFTAANPGKVMMDRNLGATKTYYAPPAANDATADQAFGMMYQWGRKDPFPRVLGSSIVAAAEIGTTIPIYGPTGTKLDDEVTDIAGTGYRKMNITGAGIISGTNTLAYAVKNPLAFIYNAATPFDWYTTVADNQNNALWGDKASKSAYDPCPKGWRIAPDGTWSDFTRDAATPANGTFPYYVKGILKENGAAGDYFSTNGRLYKVSTTGAGTPLAWCPAPGYRHPYTGVLTGVGNHGYSWSSTVSGIDGMHLGFNTQDLYPSNAGNRAGSLPVRCIQE